MVGLCHGNGLACGFHVTSLSRLASSPLSRRLREAALVFDVIGIVFGRVTRLFIHHASSRRLTLPPYHTSSNASCFLFFQSIIVHLHSLEDACYINETAYFYLIARRYGQTDCTIIKRRSNGRLEAIGNVILRWEWLEWCKT